MTKENKSSQRVKENEIVFFLLFYYELLSNLSLLVLIIEENYFINCCWRYKFSSLRLGKSKYFIRKKKQNNNKSVMMLFSLYINKNKHTYIN